MPRVIDADECIECGSCEAVCPEEAISSVISWPLFRPFMIYNTRCASRDPSIEHVRIDRRSWSQAASVRTKENIDSKQ